jgi:hypothetical protein
MEEHNQLNEKPNVVSASLHNDNHVDFAQIILGGHSAKDSKSKIWLMVRIKMPMAPICLGFDGLIIL